MARKKKRKKKMPKARNLVALQLKLMRKHAGPHQGSKQEARKNACRSKVEIDD